MKYGAKDAAFFLVDGFSLLGYSSQMAEGVEAVTEDTKPLGTAWAEVLPTGDKLGEFSQAGWYDDATDGLHAALNEQQGVSRVGCIGFASNVIGKVFTGFAGLFGSKYQRLATRGALHKANPAYQISGAIEEGVILHELSEETAAGNTEDAAVDRNADTTVPTVVVTSSSVADPSVITCQTPHGLTTGDVVMIAGHTGSTPDINGEQTATVIDEKSFSIAVEVTAGGTGGTVKRLSTQEGGSGYLQVQELVLGGYTNLTCKVRHSADDVTYADLLTFTAVTAAPDAERKTVTGTVYRHLASAWALTGAGASPSATFLIGFARG